MAVTSVRNEGPHVLEWIAHHRAIGVNHFLVFSNDCDDGTDQMLGLLNAAGLVTHVPLTNSSSKSIQWQALAQAWAHPRVQQADWVLVTDCDEFINLRAPLANLPDLIDNLPNDADALAMPWRLFGNSGQSEMGDCLTTERFTHAAPVDIALPLAWFFKSFFKPAAFRKPGVHRPKRLPDTTPQWVDGAGTRLDDRFSQADGRINLLGLGTSTDLVQLNHYSVRSAEDFIVKTTRGLPNHMDRDIELAYWVERNFNSVKDESIAGMLAGTKAVLAEILAMPGMSELQAQAQIHHRNHFRDMMNNRKQIQLFWHLNLCTGSQPPSPDLAREQIARIRNAD